MFVVGVVAAAAIVLVTRLPEALPQLPLCLTLATASAIASRQKLRLPLGNIVSDLSIAHTIDFASLLLLGPDAAMLVALLSGWAPSTIRASRANPTYRTIFNIAVPVLTVQIAGRAFELAGGRFGVFDVAMLVPLLAAVLTYIVVDSILGATGLGLSSRQHLRTVWCSDIPWTAPTCFVGAAVASVAAAAWTLGWGWLIPLAAAPVYLTFRSYRIYVDRIVAETTHHTEMQALHEKAVEALRAARESEQRYALAAAGSNDGLWDWDLTTDAFYASDRWKLMLGLPSDVPIRRVDDWFRHVHPDDATNLRRLLDRHLTGHTAHFEHEYRMRHQSGRYQWVLCRGVAVRNEQNVPIRIAGSQTDVTVQRRIQDDLQHAALHDGLTGLANRALFSELLERALSKTRRSASYVCAVLFIDLDHFKLVNDSYGHVIGDQFLVAIGKRLLQCLRPGDVLARLGGDEFAVLLDDVGESPVASVISERLHATLRAPFQLEGREIWASASIGVAFSNGNHQDPDELLRDADTAMYRSKAQGRSQTQTFDASMHESAIGRLTLETELRRAIERAEFIVYYQPIIDLRTRDVCGFESLIRWPREDGSMTPPIDFIPVAEETGLIAPLTRNVLFQSCRQMAEWQRQFGRPLTLTVNISTRLFDRPTLVAEVREAISSTGLLPRTLRLEITESFLVNGSEQVVARLDELRSIPVDLYLDDFGTGFSSLSYLHRYRLDALKIDRSFISRIGERHGDAPIVASIVNLAKELGMGVIAEGVETVAQAERLVALQCPHAQGYLFSHPLSAEGARAFLVSQQRPSHRTPALQVT